MHEKSLTKINMDWSWQIESLWVQIISSFLFILFNNSTNKNNPRKWTKSHSVVMLTELLPYLGFDFVGGGLLFLILPRNWGNRNWFQPQSVMTLPKGYLYLNRTKSRQNYTLLALNLVERCCVQYSNPYWSILVQFVLLPLRNFPSFKNTQVKHQVIFD